MTGNPRVYSVWTAHENETQTEEQWLKQNSSAPVQQAIKGETLARLSIDRLSSHWIVIEGADQGELARGPGPLPDSVLPGSRGNCVIASHRDTQFRVLPNVEIGENISVEPGGRTLLYRVTDRRVVAPTDTRSFD